MSKLNTVIRFTFLNKIRTKSFLITMLVLVLLVSIVMNIPYFIDKFSGGEQGPARVGVMEASQPEIVASLEAYLQKQGEFGFVLQKFEGESEEALRAGLKAGNIDGYLKFNQDGQSAFPTVSYISTKDSIPQSVNGSLQAALQSVKAEVITKGTLSEEQLAALTAPVFIDPVKLDASGATASANEAEADQGTEPINYVVVYALVIVFFMIITLTGNMIASEVTAEKSSRIMEILITSVSPLTQMFGKVIGTLYIGLLQILIFGGVIGINLLLPHNQTILASLNLNPADINLTMLALGLIFFVLGYLLYATLFAAIGSLVSRTEELGQAIMPITMLTLVAFYIGIFSLTAPNSLLLKISNFIPFFSPVSMVVRVGLGDAPVWEIAVSLVILLGSILFFGWLAAKIYRTGVLLYGKRPTLKELRKAMRAYKI